MSIQDIAKTAVGSIEKAHLSIVQYSSAEMEEKHDKKQAEARSRYLVSMKTFGNMGSVDVLLGDENIAKAALEKLEDLDPKNFPPVKHYYQVQFNPSSLSIRTRGNAFDLANVTPDGSNITEIIDTPPLILSFTLHFDAMVQGDCFMGDTLSTGVSSQTAMNLVNSKNASVLPQMSGLIAALNNPKNREIAFCWGKFHFEGLLDSVTAKYTMFSTTGNPVRGEANVKLSLIRDIAVLERWKESYVTAFGGTGIRNVSATGSSLGSLINLG